MVIIEYYSFFNVIQNRLALKFNFLRIKNGRKEYK